MTAPKLWSERDFDECCYAVGGHGSGTLVCAEPCRGAYCARHHAEMQADYDFRPVRAAKARELKPPREVRPLKERPPVVVFQRATLDKIIEEVARGYGLTGERLKALHGSRKFATARGEAIYRIRNRGRPWTQVAAAMGLADHTSAMEAYRKYAEGLAAQ